MFHTVRLRAGERAGELAALGMKIKRKRGQNYLLQPCPAYRESRCSIYTARPERCRLFECRQLKRVAAAEITEAIALESIRDVKRRVEEVEGFLHRLGRTDPKRPLSKRCEKINAEPLDAFSPSETVELRNQLATAMDELDAILDRDFRIAEK